VDVTSIPDSHLDLLESEAVGVFGTVNADGTPHLTPVWVDHDGDDVLVNTATGRRKTVNVRERPVAGLCVLDPTDPYRYLTAWGEVVEVTTEGAVEHIHALSRRYFGRDYDLAGEAGERVLVRVRPDSVTAR
jgi:PPOX class probable F420-dependent enzyme